MEIDSISKALGIECDNIIDYSDIFTVFDPMVSRNEALKRNAEIVECDRCGVTGNRPNMMRWHFENCKVALRTCNQCGNTIPRQGIKDYLYDKKLYCDRKCYMKSRKGKSLPPQVRYYGKSNR